MFRIFSKRKPIITFRCHEEVIDVIPHPVPASKAMPEWFSKLKRDIDGEDKSNAGTVKRCIPVLDAVTQGYIIPLWADLHIKVTKNDEGLYIWCKYPDGFWGGTSDDISNHGWEQVGDACDLKKFSLGRVLMKFSNPWAIETPAGWSVQFKNPANNWSNDIHLIEGVVDTDTYHNRVNFPYVWTGSEEGEWVIPRGTPLVHVIPFKRSPMEHVVDVLDLAKQARIDNMLASYMRDKYRKLFWHKRKAE